MSKKVLSYIFMALALVGSIAIIWLPFYLFPQYPWLPPVIFLAGFMLHGAQLRISLKIGSEKNISRTRVIIMTLLFGASYWKPLEQGFIEK